MHLHGNTFSWIPPVLTILFVFWGCVECQSPSLPATDCNDTVKCPCCSVPCPSDDSGQCNGICNNGYHGRKCYFMCPYNCISCVDAQQGNAVSNCTKCKDGYFSTSSLYQCQSKCPGGCKTCESSDSNCTSCHDGYYLTLNQCKECNESCTFCHSKTNCTSCQVGYYFDPESKECHKCDKICSSCNTSNSCICSNGCFINEESQIGCNGKTDDCSYGCRENFSQSLKCDKCIDGNYGFNCNLTCNSSCKKGLCERLTGFCIACTNGSYGNFCELQCPTHCSSSCNKTSGLCDACFGGFYGIKCKELCPTNCISCNSTSFCATCINGLYGDTCEKECSQQCLYRSCHINSGSCECSPGYYGHNCSMKNVTSTVTSPSLEGIVTEDPRKYIGPSVGATLAGTAIITALVVIALVMYRRRHTFKYVTYDIDFDSYKLDARLIDVLEDNDEFDPTYFSGTANDTRKPSGNLPVKELVQFLDKHRDDFYQEEFLKLPRGLIKSFDDAKKEENIVKNRYTGIYPYDEHRVKLQPPGSDFINACFIDGYKRKREYIASLGPTRKAMEGFQTFWRMVWQETTDVIIMLTNLMEGQSMKCEQYWPDIGTSAKYGEIKVTSQKEDIYAEFVIRTIVLAKGEEQRTLNHFHFTAWPDKRVPDDVTSLIEFRQKVKATGSVLGGPTIVHCSAGIGRTGTYIALDILIHQGKAESSLDIFECVTRMREQRTSMVQTWQQYEYLHRALAHALTFHCEPLKQSKMGLFMERLNDKKITRLFKQLDRKQENPIDCEQEAREKNKGLEGMNREGADIPGSMHRPFLHLDKKFGENSYINAIFLNSYRVKDHYLVCQTPLPETVKDFLTLIIQESCSCIVSMDSPGLRDPTIGDYYPAIAGTMFSHPSSIFDVEAQDLHINPSYKLRRLTLHFNKRSGTTSRAVHHFQCQNWPQGSRLPDVSHFLQLVQDVETMADIDRGPVLVHCLNGAERSGLYCAVSNLVQKIRVEGEVSVVNTLRTIKVRRPLAIPNKEQYMFCYRCVHQFVNSQSDTNEEPVYGNIA